MLSRCREVFEYRDFFRQFVAQQIRSRYQASFLGFLWTLLYPLLMYLSLSLVFALLNKRDLRDYGVYFFSGYMAWLFFSNTLSYAAESIVGNAGYVTRIRLPKALFPLASVAVNLIDLVASTAVVFLLMSAFGAPFSWALLILPFSVLVLVTFVCGLAFLCAMWNVFFRDFRHLLSCLLFVWFFFSPILYELKSMPAEARFYFELNPIVPFLNMFQAPIYRGVLPDAAQVVAAVSLAAVAFLAGLGAFLRAERKFYYYV